jgi:hypothetical protein
VLKGLLVKNPSFNPENDGNDYRMELALFKNPFRFGYKNIMHMNICFSVHIEYLFQEQKAVRVAPVCLKLVGIGFIVKHQLITCGYGMIKSPMQMV